MAINVLSQNKYNERRRFTWSNYNGSIYVLNEGSGWGYISVSGAELISLCKSLLGEPDAESRNALDHTYKTWSNLNPYDLANVLFHADHLVSKK